MPKYSERINLEFPLSKGLDRRMNFWHTHPAKLRTQKDVIDADRRASRDIAELQNMIDLLTEYRQALAFRYNDLSTMAYSTHLELKRNRYYHGDGISYEIRLYRLFEDTTEEDQLRETYPGKERHKAISRYKELLKEHPGCTAEMQIEKKSWER